MLLKNDFPARIYCECVSLFLLFNVYFTPKLPGKILNKQVGIAYGIFPRPYAVSVLIAGRPVTLTARGAVTRSILGCDSHCDLQSHFIYIRPSYGPQQAQRQVKRRFKGQLISMKCSVGALRLLHHFSCTVGWRASCILCGGWEGKRTSCTPCGQRPMESVPASCASRRGSPASAGALAR